MTCLHNPSKFPFLEIPSQTISCGCLHKPSKFPFLVFPYMVSHMIITTHPVLPYPWFLPNWETLLNQVTGSFPPTEWLIIQERDFPPLWWIKKPRDNFLIIQRSSLKMIQKLIRTIEQCQVQPYWGCSGVCPAFENKGVVTCTKTWWIYNDC